MSANYSKNADAARIMGLRNPSGEPVMPIDAPCELGYWCPVCRVQPHDETTDSFDARLEWSEYAGFLWCSVCNFEYPSALCVRLDGDVIPQYAADGSLNLPSHRWGGREYAVAVFLSTVESSAARAGNKEEA